MKVLGTILFWFGIIGLMVVFPWLWWILIILIGVSFLYND